MNRGSPHRKILRVYHQAIVDVWSRYKGFKVVKQMQGTPKSADYALVACYTKDATLCFVTVCVG